MVESWEIYLELYHDQTKNSQSVKILLNLSHQKLIINFNQFIHPQPLSALNSLILNFVYFQISNSFSFICFLFYTCSKKIFYLSLGNQVFYGGFLKRKHDEYLSVLTSKEAYKTFRPHIIPPPHLINSYMLPRYPRVQLSRRTWPPTRPVSLDQPQSGTHYPSSALSQS